MIRRLFGHILALGVTLLGVATLWTAWTHRPGPPPALPSQPPLAAAAPAKPEACAAAPGWSDAAAGNALSLRHAAWSLFGRPETGWEIYAPMAAHEIATSCGAESAGFAQALARWQGSHGLPASGAMDADTLDALRLAWLRRRPFVAATAHGECPPPPTPDQLAIADPAESYGGKTIELRTGALGAYRAMVAAARREDPRIGADPLMLTLFSGYRDPAGDADRCAQGTACGTAMRANCSAHRTGLAVDLYLGAAPGYRPDVADDPNRLYQSRTPAYLWMVANAGRFGWVNYPFEPWHWEWTGEPP